MHRWARGFILLIAGSIALSGLTGCAAFRTRLTKALLPHEFTYELEPAPPPASITFKSGYRGELPESYPQRPAPPARSRLPLVTRDGWIEVQPQHAPVQVRLFARNIGTDEGEFFEIKSFTGNIPYEIPSELRFFESLTPTSQPVRIVLRNLKNAYNGYTVRDNALILVEVIDPELKKTWRYLFTYKDFGSRQKISFNVVFNVPLQPLRDLGLPLNGQGVGNAAFTMSYSFGYRFRTQNRVARWLGDKVSIVGLLGTSADLDFLDNGIFNQLSLGVGIEFYDFLSLNLLMDTAAIGHLSTNPQWGLVVGFDAVRFADFSRKLTQRLFSTNQLK